MPPSSNKIGANNSGAINQVMKISNPNKVWNDSFAKYLLTIVWAQNQLKMRIRLSYQQNGNNLTEQSDVNNFPLTTWQ